MAAARGGSALASTSGALTPAQIGNPGKQIAAVFMLKNVADACIVDRIIAFHNSAGLDATWALVDEKKIDEAGMSQLGAAGVRVARPVALRGHTATPAGPWAPRALRRGTSGQRDTCAGRAPVAAAPPWHP